MRGALEGIKVLDLARLLPGNYCTMLLADMGAEVIKIEEPAEGDYWRSRYPTVGGMNAAFWTLNRNKKSIALNLKEETGKEIFRELVKKTDVVYESFRPRVMDRLGLGYQALSQINPRLVYCALTGYGQDGPYRDLVGHDINYIGLAGILGITGQSGGPPVIPGVQIADLGGGGLLCAFSIVTALMARESTGKGQYIDISMTDFAVSWNVIAAGWYFATRASPGRGATPLIGGVPYYNVYETKNGQYITIGCNEPKFWATLCRAVGHEELIEHQFATGEKREEVFQILRNTFLTRTREEWLELFEGQDICYGPVNSVAEAFSDPQLLHRGMVKEVERSDGLKLKLVGPAPKFSATPADIRSLAPDHGEHTETILRELGYSDAQIEGLRRAGVVK